MKTKRLILFLMSCVLVMGCSKSNNDDSDNPAVASEEAKQIISEANLVSDAVSDIFHQAESAEEMSAHLDQIEALEQVDKAWAEDDAVFAQLKTGITMFWYYPPNDDEYAEALRTRGTSELDSLVNRMKETRAATSNKQAVLASKQKICIINQVSRDWNLDYVTSKLSEDAQTLRNDGYQVTEIPSEEFTPKFLRESLTDYNVVILTTHGVYIQNSPIKENNGQHWIFTGVEMQSISKENFDDLCRGYAQIGILKEDRLHDIMPSDYKYLVVSEKWLDNNLGQFPSNSMMFATVCQTLKGNDSFYNNVLKHKNLGCYLGFDESVGCHFSIEKSLDMFMSLMVLGSTAQGAYNMLDADYRKGYGSVSGKNHQTKIATLKYLQRDDKTEVSICDAMDLGLSVMWGTRNLGAQTPFEYGDFYAWGEIIPDTDDSGREYQYWTTKDHDAMEFLGYDIKGNPRYDAATAELGNDWRLPTKEECEELISHCIPICVKSKEFYNMKEWVSGSKGGVLLAFSDAIKQKKGGYIYLPYYWNTGGGYWTSNEVPEGDRTELWSEIPHFQAYSLLIRQPGETGTIDGYYLPRIGKDKRVRLSSIRPVYDPK